jgi:multidrug transporter EmrE-like cation transporter
VENAASILILVSGLAHAVVNAILKAGNDKMSRRALIDGFSALILAPAAFLVPLPANAWHWLISSVLVHGVYLFALIKSFEQSDMTVAYPIARGLAPMLAAAGAVTLFHEPHFDRGRDRHSCDCHWRHVYRRQPQATVQRTAVGAAERHLHRRLYRGRCPGDAGGANRA